MTKYNLVSVFALIIYPLVLIALGLNYVFDYQFGIILPCMKTPILPPNAKRLMTEDAYYVSENLLALRNTRIGNLMDQCVLTLPTGHASCGLSLMTAPNGEARLLRTGQAAERALS